MTPEEYFASESDNNDDDDILGEYLIEEEEDDDIAFISMPKIRLDFDAEFDRFYRVLKQCKNKEQMKNALRKIVGYTSQIAITQHEINYIQDRAKDLEFNIQMMEQQ